MITNIDMTHDAEIVNDSGMFKSGGMVYNLQKFKMDPKLFGIEDADLEFTAPEVYSKLNSEPAFYRQ